MKKILRSFLCIILCLTCLLIFSGCPKEPSTVDKWFIQTISNHETEKGAAIGQIYEKQILTSEYITLKFFDGKVEFNRNGEITNGTYNYNRGRLGCAGKSSSTAFTRKDEKLEVLLENGVVYEGTCFQGWGPTTLKISNEKETLVFGAGAEKIHSNPYIDDFSNGYYNFLEIIDIENIQDSNVTLKFTMGQEERIIDDKNFIKTFISQLENLRLYIYVCPERIDNYDGSYVYDDLRRAFLEDESNTACSWRFILGEYVSDAYKFYYDKETEFFLFTRMRNYGEIYCISANVDSSFKLFMNKFI